MYNPISHNRLVRKHLYAAQRSTITILKRNCSFQTEVKEAICLNDSILGFYVTMDQFILTFLMNILILSTGLLNTFQVHIEAICSQPNTDLWKFCCKPQITSISNCTQWSPHPERDTIFLWNVSTDPTQCQNPDEYLLSSTPCKSLKTYVPFVKKSIYSNHVNI
jgi:hypothetical protein